MEEEAQVAKDMQYYQEVSAKIYDTTQLFNEKLIPVLKQALVDADKMLQAQEQIAGQMGLALDKVPEANHLEDLGLATRPAHQVKNWLNVLFTEYQDAHKDRKEEMATGVQGEAFRKFQEDALMHSNWVHDQGIMLYRIIKIQQE